MKQQHLAKPARRDFKPDTKFTNPTAAEMKQADTLFSNCGNRAARSPPHPSYPTPTHPPTRYHHQTHPLSLPLSTPIQVGVLTDSIPRKEESIRVAELELNRHRQRHEPLLQIQCKKEEARATVPLMPMPALPRSRSSSSLYASLARAALAPQRLCLELGFCVLPDEHSSGWRAVFPLLSALASP